jgi:CBS domain-containing protein
MRPLLRRDATDLPGRPRGRRQIGNRAVDAGPISVPPETVDDDPFVAALMTTPVVAITADARLPVALRVMAAEHARHLVVVDDGRYVGLLQEGEVARLLLGPATPREVPPLPVGAVCRAVPRLGADERRSTAARRMHAAGVD